MRRPVPPPPTSRVSEPAPAVPRGAASAWAEVWEALAMAAALANLARQAAEEVFGGDFRRSEP